MKNISKQFVLWATNSKNKPFLWARLKLTAFYTVGVALILIVFSFAVYGIFVNNINSDLEYEGVDFESEANVEMQIIDKAQDRLQTILLFIDVLIIFLIAGLSYYLAGKTLEPIESSYLRQKKFVADAAHELRTPLAVMRTGTEAVLGADNSKEKYKKMLVSSLEEMRYLSAIVDDLLFLANGDSLRKVEFTKFNFSNLLQKQIDLMRVYAKKKGVEISDEIKEELYVNGNKAYLKRLLANILKNAIDYNKSQGKVNVFLKQNKNCIELKVVDTGIGISEDDLKHIMERFYKADKSHSKQSGGAGLGLSIVDEIIKLHKGTLDISSKLNEGTKVVVTLFIKQEV